MIILINEKQRDLNEAKSEDQRNQQSIFFTVKMRVKRKPELEEDYEMFKLFWKREIQKALEQIGDVRFLVIMT